MKQRAMFELPPIPLNRVLLSSKSVERATPQETFDALNAEFNFTLDVCATPENAKCDRYFTEEENGLEQKWEGSVWCNPPYGRGIINQWIRKGYESSLKGATVVMLIPSNTDTSWWHDYVMKGEIWLIRGRLKFGGAKDNAPFASAVVVFRSKDESGKSHA